MRILSEIPHPYFKITVFKHQDQVSLKINHLVYETVLKFRDGEIPDEEAFIDGLQDSEFIREMEQHVHQIHQSRMKLIKKHQNSL